MGLNTKGLAVQVRESLNRLALIKVGQGLRT